jgi:hypothetical protein
VKHTRVFDERIFEIESRRFGVDAPDGVAQTAKFVSTVGERDLRNQQNDEDDKNYRLLLN